MPETPPSHRKLQSQGKYSASARSAMRRVSQAHLCKHLSNQQAAAEGAAQGLLIVNLPQPSTGLRAEEGMQEA